MTPQEQAAFVEAYATNVAMVNSYKVEKFVKKYANGEDLEYDGDYTTIMDALGMWNNAIKWNIEQAQRKPMKKYEVIATTISYHKLIIEAENDDEAWDMAREADGGDFELHDQGNWEIYGVKEITE